MNNMFIVKKDTIIKIGDNKIAKKSLFQSYAKRNR